MTKKVMDAVYRTAGSPMWETAGVKYAAAVECEYASGMPPREIWDQFSFMNRLMYALQDGGQGVGA